MIYIFYGPEEFLRAEAIAALRAQMGDPSAAGMNMTVLEGRKLTLAELINTAAALPFLVDSRLVIVQGLLTRLEGRGGKPSKADQPFVEGLAAYLPKLPPSTLLVFDEDSLLNDQHPVLRYAREHAQSAQVQLCTRLSEADLRRWLAQRAKSKGGLLSPDAIEALVSLSDIDLRQYDQEVEKLVTFAGERAISGADVQNLVQASRSVDVFAMVDALGQRNGRKAIEQFHALVEDGEPPGRLLFMITRQFRMIMQAKDLSERRAPIGDVMRSLGAAKFVADKVLSQSRAFNMAQLENIYARLLETDQSIKTGKSEPLLAIDLLIAEIASRSDGTRARSRV